MNLDNGELLSLFAAGRALLSLGTSPDLVQSAARLAMENRDVYDLLLLAPGASDADRNIILSTIDELVAAPVAVQPTAPIGFIPANFFASGQADDLARFKNRLRIEIDKKGGIAAVARRAGYDRAHLSRWLVNSTRPTRKLLFAIGRACGLSERNLAEIAQEEITKKTASPP